MDQISKGKDLKGKTYKGLVNGWPGQMTGAEVIEHMIDKAASSQQGFDPLTGHDYKQLISKFLMGAVFYSQAVDNYLDERLDADNKPNDTAYKKGAHYTGKEHVWDEAFGYFGAPAHAMKLDAKQAHGIAKMKDVKSADANGDGSIDLYREMTFAHAYYAADSDKAGSNYLHTITRAFLDGRTLISAADGRALTANERAELKGYAKTIKTNWEKVIAEAAFKYAGSTYKDLDKLQTIIESNGDANKSFKSYAKHWSEMKGFLMALETSGKNLGEVGVKLNRLVGVEPRQRGHILGSFQFPAVSIERDGAGVVGTERTEVEIETLRVGNQCFLVTALGHVPLANAGGGVASVTKHLRKSQAILLNQIRPPYP